MITGKQSELLSAASAMLINALKSINTIPDDVHLLSADILEKILKMKKNTSYKTTYCLNIQEVLKHWKMMNGKKMQFVVYLNQ